MFRQNNSGGSFYRDEAVGNYVFIESTSPTKANLKAEEVGIYFNGCVNEHDCPCCGDRWHPVDSYDGNEEVLIYDTPISDYENGWIEEETIHIYYLDGRHEVKTMRAK
ncbi:MAG: hypothetical protein H8D27_07870 [Chlorobium phaeobacteroides]|nr:hypothetical protein [Chlorobium phaeobacteroides]